MAQSPVPPQPTDGPALPTRDPHTPGYVLAKELPGGSAPQSNVDGAGLNAGTVAGIGLLTF